MIVGVDEVGRGAIAGAVFAAAVILPKNCNLLLNDSKQLTPKKRFLLDRLIHDQVIDCNVGTASVFEVDKHNVLQASLLAMKRSIEGLRTAFQQVLIDGNQKPKLFLPEHILVKTIIGGDALCPAISAASIIAKVARDRYMSALAKYYPEYQFEKHKGYPTALHVKCLDEYGISRLHRKSFKPIKDRLNPI